MAESQTTTKNTVEKKQAPRERAGGPRRRFGGGRRRRIRERPRPEFDHRVIDIRRVARVVKGGRRFSFSVAVIAGNRNGKVGVGIGKGTDTALAIEKAFRQAKKNMIEVARTKEGSIPHQVDAKVASTTLRIYPTPGRGGISAGSAVRAVLEFAGVKDVGAKLLSRTKNKINIARATISALQKLQRGENKHTRHTSCSARTEAGTQKI